MWGLVEEARVADCEGRSRFKKIVARLLDGSVVETKCFLDEEVTQSMKIVSFYSSLAKRAGAWRDIKP